MNKEELRMSEIELDGIIENAKKERTEEIIKMTDPLKCWPHHIQEGDKVIVDAEMFYEYIKNIQIFIQELKEIE